MQSLIDQVNPPTILPASAGNYVNVSLVDFKTQTTDGVGHRQFPSYDQENSGHGVTVKFTVRLSDRESGVDKDNVYIQIKDPDSKYQDTNITDLTDKREHKVFTTDFKDDTANRTDSGSATYYLYNFDAGDFDAWYGNPAAPGWPERGAVSSMVDNLHAMAVGHALPINNTQPPYNISPTQTAPQPGWDPNSYKPFGQEYECQYLNAQWTGNGTGGSATKDPADSDYGIPYYLAGVDDTPKHSASDPSNRVAETDD